MTGKIIVTEHAIVTEKISKRVWKSISKGSVCFRTANGKGKASLEKGKTQNGKASVEKGKTLLQNGKALLEKRMCSIMI